MANINNYPYTNMVYQNVDWMVDEVEEAKAMSERAEQTVQEMNSRVSTLETDMLGAQAQLAAHEVAINQNSTEISTLRDSLSNVSGKVTDLDAQLPVVRATAISAEEKADKNTNDITQLTTKVDQNTTNIAANTTEISTKVTKAGAPKILYGTNHASREAALSYSQAAQNNTIVQRTEEGTIRTNPPTNIFDATNKKYVDKLKWTTILDDTFEADSDSNLKNYTNFTYVNNCEGLRIYTVIDNGDTNPTLYDSTDLNISINNEYLFSIAGGVPKDFTTDLKTEDFTNLYTWDWSSFGFGNVTAQILTNEKFTRESLLDASVAIHSYLSNDTYNVISVNESATSADAPGYKGYQVTFQKDGTTDKIYGVLATNVTKSVCPELEEGMLLISSFDSTASDMSEFTSGQWSYTGKIVAHKIATGSLDMKFISPVLAETETSGSGNRDNIAYGAIVPADNIKHYAMHPAENNIQSIQVKLSNGVIRKGTRIIVLAKGEV